MKTKRDFSDGLSSQKAEKPEEVSLPILSPIPFKNVEFERPRAKLFPCLLAF